jgi:hypothetical protein
MVQLDSVKDFVHADRIFKHGNSLQVMAEAVCWGKHGAGINAIGPAIVITTFANE